MEEDRKTQQHAFILARTYNLAPFDNMKTERITTRPSDISSCWLATKNRRLRCFAQYHSDMLGKGLITGDPCTHCWGDGKFWEDEEVPLYVFCSLSGFTAPIEFLNTVFEPGEPIKIGHYLLEQRNAPNCFYEHLDDTFEIIWTPHDILSTLLITTKPDNIVRMDASAGGCFKIFEVNNTQAEIS